jgi:hypothetical protein
VDWGIKDPAWEYPVLLLCTVANHPALGLIRLATVQGAAFKSTFQSRGAAVPVAPQNNNKRMPGVIHGICLFSFFTMRILVHLTCLIGLSTRPEWIQYDYDSCKIKELCKRLSFHIGRNSSLHLPIKQAIGKELVSARHNSPKDDAPGIRMGRTSHSSWNVADTDICEPQQAGAGVRFQ